MLKVRKLLNEDVGDGMHLAHNPLPEYVGRGHDCTSILDSIAKGISSIFRMVHPIPRSPFIKFFTGSTYFCMVHLCTYKCSYAHA